MALIISEKYQQISSLCHSRKKHIFEIKYKNNKTTEEGKMCFWLRMVALDKSENLWFSGWLEHLNIGQFKKVNRLPTYDTY